MSTKLTDPLEAERTWESDILSDVQAGLKQAINSLARIRKVTGGSRELSIAQTEAETSLLWLKAHGNAGVWAE